MALNKYKLGDLIEEISIKNNDGKLKEKDVVGISTQKMFIDTKANLDGVNLNNYKVVLPNHFAYVPDTSRRGDKISLAFNNTSNSLLVSSISIVFKISNEAKILPYYLLMYFKRAEFDRYSRFNSWGSAREPFGWNDMCDIDIELPDITIQQKYVDIYKAMIENQRVYESKLDDLKLVCDGYIEDLRKKMPCKKIGEYCNLKNDIRNKDEKCTNVKGLSIQKCFIETKADTTDVSLSNYKVVQPNEIAYVPNTARMGDKMACGLCAEECCVSPVYEIIEINDKTKLLPNFLFLWFKRNEFDRYARYNSWGSVRENIDWNTLSTYTIPIPDIKVQESIAEIFKVLETRKEINEKLKEQIKDICPILIQGALKEGQNKL